MFYSAYFYLIFMPLTGLMSLLSICFPSKGQQIDKLWSNLALKLIGVPYECDMSALDPNQTYIFMVNHQSQLDIPLMSHCSGRPASFIAKKSLLELPLFGRAMVNAGHVAIDRSNRRAAMKSIDNAVKLAKSGRSIIIFPEGTRATDLTQLQDFKVGGGIIALKTGLPVAPVIITGSGEVLPKNKIRLTRTKIRIKALPPVDTQGKYTIKDREAFMKDLHELMNNAYMEQRNA